MPRISFFYGIAVWMYPGDHGRPHLHATYAEHRASIALDSGTVLAGGLPPRQLGLIRKWISLHQDELAANWRRAKNRQDLAKIDPLP
jgi:hypothetical protein